MTDNVVGLHGRQPPQLGQPNPALVDLLGDLLELAKTGRLQSLIATGFAADGARIGVWGDAHTNVYEMLGALTWLQAEYIRRHSDDVP